jgi:hypothetical protein
MFHPRAGSSSGAFTYNSELADFKNLFLDARPGVDVMITIFLRFFPILGEKIGVFLKNQCYDHNFCKN